MRRYGLWWPRKACRPLPGHVRRSQPTGAGASTQVGDRTELAAIRPLFAGARGPAISATKSATGHLLGAAGALASILSILALRDQIAPPTLNLVSPDEDAADLDLVRTAQRPMPLATEMVNGFGFGGVNTTLLIKMTTR